MTGVFKNGPFVMGATDPDGTWVGTPLAGATFDEVGAGVDEVGAGVMLMAVLFIGDGV